MGGRKDTSTAGLRIRTEVGSTRTGGASGTPTTQQSGGVVIQTGGSSLRRAVGVEQQHPNETDISSTPPWKASKAGGLRIRKWFIHRAPGGGYNRNFHVFFDYASWAICYQAARIIWYRRLIVRPIGSLRRSRSFLQEWDREFGWRSKPTGVCRKG